MAKLKTLLTPQQELFLSVYCNPKSKTFGDAYNSAIEAKYKKQYAENITHLMPDWLSENIGDLKRLKKAEKVLDETLDMDTINRRLINDEIVETQEPALLRIKQDTAKFIASGLGKAKYSSRQEMTGADGQPINITFDNSFKNDSAR